MDYRQWRKSNKSIFTSVTGKKIIRQKYIAVILTVSGLTVIILSLLYLIFYQYTYNASTTRDVSLPYPVSVSPVEDVINIDLNEIFKYRNSQKLSENVNYYKSQVIRLMATGDVIPARSVNSRTVRENDFRNPYLKTADLLKTADIVFINLESPLVKNCPTTVEGMVFCGDVRNVEGLKFANVSVANLANNHLANYGKEGIENTVSLLKENGIAVTGLGEAAIITVKGKSFGFLGYNDIGGFAGIENADVIKIASDVAALKNKTDYVVVAFHWGTEYVSDPTGRQKELAHLAVENGADLIIGNHPHWVQGVEIYKNKFVAYAHGNFVFDQMWSRETREGVVGEYVFGENGLNGVSYYPVIIEDYAQPRFADESEANIILEKMKKSSEQILLENKM